jgi:hypothetical protein
MVDRNPNQLSMFEGFESESHADFNDYSRLNEESSDYHYMRPKRTTREPPHYTPSRIPSVKKPITKSSKSVLK